jgi:hypothetical protein
MSQIIAHELSNEYINIIHDGISYSHNYIYSLKKIKTLNLEKPRITPIPSKINDDILKVLARIEGKIELIYDKTYEFKGSVSDLVDSDKQISEIKKRDWHGIDIITPITFD